MWAQRMNKQKFARKILKRMINGERIFILTDIEINYKTIITKTV